MKKIYLLLFIFLYGCVYYNTLFNAKKEFETAMNITNTRGINSARIKYNNVIKKCAYIVKEHKNSKYADDALFLLSKALFYKGANYTQAIDNFKQLIQFYPNSEFVPEAKIYIARALYMLNKKEEAISSLKDFLNSKTKNEYKSKAMLIIAQYFTDDKEYQKAEKYLTELIEKYKKSEEFPKALIALGNLYYEEKDYKKSLDVFKRIAKQKRFEKKVRLDALYYIALNYFKLGKKEEAFEVVNKLLLKENRTVVIPKIRILKARILIQKGEYEKGISLLEAVYKDNRRTDYSAEAVYRIAEVYFKYLKNYQKAIKYYDKVKMEKRTSPFKEDALIKSSIASQIIQYYKPNNNMEPLKLINQQMKLAEYYFDFLNKPDSTLKIYNNIFNFKDSLITKLNNVTNQIKNTTEVDSTDSLNYQNYKLKIDNLKQEKKHYENIITTYNNEIIPKIYFNEIWIYKNIYKDSLKAKKIFNELKSKYPKNKYYYAADELLKGKEVIFHTPQEIKDWEIYDSAIAIMDSLPDKAVLRLNKIKDTTDDKLKEKVKFAIGYLLYFNLKDTLSAKPYFNDLYDNQNYSSIIKKFYNGKKFTHIDSLSIPNSLLIQDEEKDKKKKR